MNQKMGNKGGRKGRKNSIPKEIAPRVGNDDDSSAEECPVTPTEQTSPSQTELSVRKRRRTNGTTNSADDQHASSNSGAYQGSSSELEMLLAAAQSSVQSPVGQNGDVGGPAGVFRFSYTLRSD